MATAKEELWHLSSEFYPYPFEEVPEEVIIRINALRQAWCDGFRSGMKQTEVDGDKSEEITVTMQKESRIVLNETLENLDIPSSSIGDKVSDSVYPCTCYNANGEGFEELCDYCRFLEDCDDTEEYEAFKRRSAD